MLVAALNTCTKEECEEEDSNEETMSPSTMLAGVEAAEDSEQRRKDIKNKIMSVGRAVRVLLLLRCISSSSRVDVGHEIAERNPKKSPNSRIFPVQANYRTGRRPPDLKVSMLFEDARKSDIENKRLPPDRYDADSEEGKALFASGPLPSTLAEHQEGTPSTPVAANGVAAGLEATLSSSILPSPLSLSTSSSISFP
ncbi:hypothetical protein D9757_006031 [Collybiopsis confluens]|uniref:Uncharacterized protein n=1 Tax=Collybiopsis confluens TaxID=2823264 RepID=A0A8H5HUY2_9AGAR|nr:hypothetical protein D9757_006031 [Collybiopsis confluens]